MRAQDRESFAHWMFLLGIAFRPAVTEEHLQVYFDALADLEMEHLQPAMMDILKVRTNAFLPTPGEIREVAAQIARTQRAARDELRALKPRPDYTPNFKELVDQLFGNMPKIARGADRVGDREPTPEDRAEHEAKKRRAISSLEEFRRRRSSESA